MRPPTSLHVRLSAKVGLLPRFHLSALLAVQRFRWLRHVDYNTPGWSRDFRTAALHVRRVKQGTPSTHPILGDELRALQRLQREQEPKSPFVRSIAAGCAGRERWIRGRSYGPYSPLVIRARGALKSCLRAFASFRLLKWRNDHSRRRLHNSRDEALPPGRRPRITPRRCLPRRCSAAMPRRSCPMPSGSGSAVFSLTLGCSH